MTREDYEQIESSQRQHHEVLLQEEKRYREYITLANTQYVLLGAKLFKDGNEWCCLLGDNIQDGVVGFHEIPQQAILNWYEDFSRGELESLKSKSKK